MLPDWTCMNSPLLRSRTKEPPSEVEMNHHEKDGFSTINIT